MQTIGAFVIMHYADGNIISVVPTTTIGTFVIMHYADGSVGCGQVVRQRVLVPSFGGSNPSIPTSNYENTPLTGCVFELTQFMSAKV